MIKDLNEKKLFKGIGTVLLYFFLAIVYQIPFLFLIEKKNFSSSWSLFIVQIMLVLTFILIYRKDLKSDFKDFKKNWKKIQYLFFISLEVCLKKKLYLITLRILFYLKIRKRKSSLKIINTLALTN